MKRIPTFKLALTAAMLLLAPAASFAQTWKSLPSMNKVRFEASAVQFKDDIFVFNGFREGINIQPSVEVFDAGTKKWFMVGNTSVSLGNAVTHNGVIRTGNEAWFIGGRIGKHPGKVSSDVWVFNLNSRQWSKGPQLPVAGAAGGAALVNNKIHWFGGTDANAKCDVANHFVFDLNERSAGWQDITHVAAMPSPRNHFSTAVYNGIIYAIGGQYGHDNCPGKNASDVNLVHAFNPSTNKWTAKARLPSAQSHTESSTFVHKNAIYVVGGEVNGNKIFRFDPRNNDWDTVLQLPSLIVAPVARVVDDQLVVSSGGSPNFRFPTNLTLTTSMQPLLLGASSQPVVEVEEPEVVVEEPIVEAPIVEEPMVEEPIVVVQTPTVVISEPVEPVAIEPVVVAPVVVVPVAEIEEPQLVSVPETVVQVEDTVTDVVVPANRVVISLEAEYFDTRESTNTHAWVTNNLSGSSNNASIITTPDYGALVNTASGTPSVGYYAYFDKPGTWYVWIRGWGDTVAGEGKSDSVHAGLNSALLSTSDKIQNFPAGWNWSNSTRDGSRASMNIPSAGIHLVNLWMREDGLAVDKIVLTNDPDYQPGGMGPVHFEGASADNDIYAGVSCVDSDGDGWGWQSVDGVGRSCKMPLASTAAPSDVYEDVPCLDYDGDGWGWQQPAAYPGRSCRI